MKFSVIVNMARFDTSQTMEEVSANVLDMVKIADQGGFDIVWTAEHHTIELTISPNPFQLLAHWGAHTKNVRLGTGVVAAPYWNPIRLAGEAAMCDILTGGRLELGLGRGAYQYEFDRMAGGMPQGEGGKYLREIIPAVQRLWEGDYVHEGEIWQFPSAACVPKPLQKFPSMWIAARDQNTFEFALKNNCHVMSTALRKPFDEVEDLENRFQAARAAAGNPEHLTHATLRVCCVYEDPKVLDTATNAVINFGRNFENLFRNAGTVINGFPEPVDFATVAARGEYQQDALKDNLLIGTPDEVIAKIERYQSIGIDHIMISPTFGLPDDVARRSVELLCDKVIPHFRSKQAATKSA